MRMFKPREAHPNIKPTSATRKYTKECSYEEEEEERVGREGEEGDLNEEEMSVVCLPPTPLKPEDNQNGAQSGVSSQILPLNRFSSESSLPRSGVPPAYKEPPRPKPVAEVSPFSTKKVKYFILQTKKC